MSWWAAILATHDALLEMGGPGLPELHVNRARANLIRAGQVESGDYTDADLKSIAAADGARIWSATMGTIFKDEPIVGPDSELYICTTQHQAQANWAPGSEGGRTLFRPLRSEPGGTWRVPGVHLGRARPLWRGTSGPRGPAALHPHQGGGRHAL